MRLFPHEVKNVETVLSMLETQDPDDHEVCLCCLGTWRVLKDNVL